VSTKENEGVGFWCMITGCLFCIVLGLFLGIKLCGNLSTDLKKEAISHGAAEYVLVNGGPETKFVWKEKP
jgi:hypothetical protein